MYELKKLKVVEMSDQKFYLTEISKRQKDIFKAFNLAIPVILEPSGVGWVKGRPMNLRLAPSLTAFCPPLTTQSLF